MWQSPGSLNQIQDTPVSRMGFGQNPFPSSLLIFLATLCFDRGAVCVARFARDIVWKMKDIIQRLEVSLGPETSDLALRVGIHR